MLNVQPLVILHFFDLKLYHTQWATQKVYCLNIFTLEEIVSYVFNLEYYPTYFQLIFRTAGITQVFLYISIPASQVAETYVV